MATENPRVWFKSISLENVRSFGTKQTINFTDKDGNAARWNVILGDNGTGKTTVLRSICWPIEHKFNSVKFPKEITYLKRNSLKSKPYLRTELQNFNLNFISEAVLRTDLLGDSVFPVRHSKGEGHEGETAPVLFGYGAGRKMGNGGVAQEDVSHVISLFDEDTSLINAEEWLIQADYLRLKEKSIYEKRFVEVTKAIKALFRDEGSGVMFDTSSGVPKVRLATKYGLIPIHELSLGYKTLIAWMVDFAKGLLDRYPDSPNPLAEPAVCLVDELDLHLHPKFQRNIIQFLTETFPNTQFIVTAHSPLIVQSAEDANIIVLRREGNETIVETDRINVHDWRIDQILSSDLFGGVGGRAPDIEEKMTRRRVLLRKDTLDDAEKRELAGLEKEMNNLPVSESREALKALDIIGQALIN